MLFVVFAYFPVSKKIIFVHIVPGRTIPCRVNPMQLLPRRTWRSCCRWERQVIKGQSQKSSWTNFLEILKVQCHDMYCFKFATRVNSSGGKFAAGVNYTGDKIATGINNTGGKFFHRYRWCSWYRWQICHRCQWYRYQGHRMKICHFPQWYTQWFGGNWFMKKTWSREFRGIVPLSLGAIYIIP